MSVRAGARVQCAANAVRQRTSKRSEEARIRSRGFSPYQRASWQGGLGGGRRPGAQISPELLGTARRKAAGNGQGEERGLFGGMGPRVTGVDGANADYHHDSARAEQHKWQERRENKALRPCTADCNAGRHESDQVLRPQLSCRRDDQRRLPSRGCPAAAGWHKVLSNAP